MFLGDGISLFLIKDSKPRVYKNARRGWNTIWTTDQIAFPGIWNANTFERYPEKISEELEIPVTAIKLGELLQNRRAGLHGAS